jgi:nucleoid DNA-binding protein
MAHVTKKEIVKQIADELNETQLLVKKIVQMTFDKIIDTLEEEGRIELRNFGVFEVKRRKPRRARNPRTNKPVEVAAKNVVTFQPGKEMEEKIREMSNPPEPKKKPRKSSRTVEADEIDREDSIPVGVGAGLDGELGEAPVLAGSSELPLKPR